MVWTSAEANDSTDKMTDRERLLYAIHAHPGASPAYLQSVLKGKNRAAARTIAGRLLELRRMGLIKRSDTIINENRNHEYTYELTSEGRRVIMSGNASSILRRLGRKMAEIEANRAASLKAEKEYWNNKIKEEMNDMREYLLGGTK